ncbi:unnamed protein product [Eruca vesicaria subsp. sativa]|uniref:Uncharacterized protein n=1 Tax=Eruca vesicaria subsp. sativa TaxID=29727 RepID=A0ABC8L0X6_ERUVS|nr:unnamed protein product [Eruca vesicaria subsp. sativa]
MKAAKRWSVGNLVSLPGARHRVPARRRLWIIMALSLIIMTLSLITMLAIMAYMYPHNSKRACYMVSSRGCKALSDWLQPLPREYSDDEIAARVGFQDSIHVLDAWSIAF